MFQKSQVRLRQKLSQWSQKAKWQKQAQSLKMVDHYRGCRRTNKRYKSSDKIQGSGKDATYCIFDSNGFPPESNWERLKLLQNCSFRSDPTTPVRLKPQRNTEDQHPRMYPLAPTPTIIKFVEWMGRGLFTYL